MHIAIAGTGDLAKYLTTAFLARSHHVTILSRAPKPWFSSHPSPNVTFHLTTFTVEALTPLITDCDGLVSAIQDATLTNIPTHLALLAACTASPSCKRFIPSEYIGDLTSFPLQPAFYHENHQPIRDALKAQTAVEWTLFMPGWLADYIVPENKRWIRDIGEFHPIEFEKGEGKEKRAKMIIPGTGEERISMTAARDVAAAVVRLFESREKWENIIFVCGETTTWNAVGKVLKEEGRELEIGFKGVEELERTVKEGGEEEVLVAQFGLWSASGATEVPEGKVKEHRERYFRGLGFRGVRELVREGMGLREGEVL